VGEAIKKNWRYPALAGDKNLVATAAMELGSDGSILSSRITVSSGNAEFDSSILRAIHETVRVIAPQTERDKRILINFNSQEIPE
jgi:colicin import membrane protein